MIFLKLNEYLKEGEGFKSWHKGIREIYISMILEGITRKKEVGICECEITESDDLIDYFLVKDGKVLVIGCSDFDSNDKKYFDKNIILRESDSFKVIFYEYKDGQSLEEIEYNISNVKKIINIINEYFE